MADNHRRPPPPQQGRPQQQRPQNDQRPPPARKRERIDEVRALALERKSSVQQLLARTPEDAERFIRGFMLAIESNPDLVACSKGSILRALLHSAEVGLTVGGAYPHAYLIPYKPKGAPEAEAQFQISVWGYVELIRRSGQVKKVWADVIYSNDEYEVTSGTDGKQIVHKPKCFADRGTRGELVGAYACALLENGETVFEPVSAEDLKLARAQNRGNSPAWELWPDQQRQKVALKRLQKYLPKGPADRALELDEDPTMRSRIIDAEGHEVQQPFDDDEPAQQQGPLDRAVEQHRVDQQTTQQHAAQQPANTTLDRDRLFEMLCDADERYKSQRALVDGWDDIEALSVLSYLRTVLADGVGVDGHPPVMPDCMRLDAA